MPRPKDPPIPVDLFVGGNARLAVSVAGLLAADPALRGTQLRPDEWQQRLDDYLASDRP